MIKTIFMIICLWLSVFNVILFSNVFKSYNGQKFAAIPINRFYIGNECLTSTNHIFYRKGGFIVSNNFSYQLWSSNKIKIIPVK